MFDGFGVRRGDFVFIHREGTTNGCTKPRVPRLGELEGWVRENPFIDGESRGWRRELEELGLDVASDPNAKEFSTNTVKRPTPGDTSLHWFGEVTDVRHHLYPLKHNLTIVNR